MLEIVYSTRPELIISGTAVELQLVRREILTLIMSNAVQISFEADSAIKPSPPYNLVLSKLLIVKGQCPTRVSLKNGAVHVEGSPACLDAFASFFDFAPDTWSSVHSHYEYREDQWVSPDSIPLVISVK